MIEAVPVAIAAALYWRPRRELIAAALIAAICLAPMLGLTPFTFQFYSTVADHYLYLAMLGPALALSFVLSSRAADRIVLVGGLLLIPLATLARAQAAVWHDSGTLFAHVLQARQVVHA